MKCIAKKMLAFVLSIALLATALMGCSKQTQEEKKENANGSVVKEQETKNDGDKTTSNGDSVNADPFGKYDNEVTLRGAFLSAGAEFIKGNPDYDSAEKNMYIQAYKDSLNVNVTYDWVSADQNAYVTKWNLAMAQGNLPDFGMVYSDQYLMLLDAGLVMDMTDIFDEYASDTYKEFLDLDGGVTRGYVTHNGRMMGLPLTGGQPDDIAIFAIRKDWLDKVNMKVPTTIDELVAAAQAFVDNKLGGEGTYGLALSKGAFGNSSCFTAVGFANGFHAYPNTWIEDESGKLVNGSTLDSMKAPLLKLQEMYAKGLINQDFAVAQKDIVKEDVVNGKVGILYDIFWSGAGITECLNSNPDSEWVYAELPTVDGEKAYEQGSLKKSQFMFVNKNCKNPEAVVKLLNLEIDLINNKDTAIVEKYTTHVNPEDSSKNIQTSKYAASIVLCGRPWTNLVRYQEATRAYETGKKEFTLALAEKSYNDFFVKIEAGQRGWWTVFGPGGTFSIIDQVKNDNRILIDKYQSNPTQTMTEKSSILTEALNASMEKVIMGDDISVYEQAVEEWFTNGGQIITDEVNAWYEANK